MLILCLSVTINADRIYRVESLINFSGDPSQLLTGPDEIVLSRHIAVTCLEIKADWQIGFTKQYRSADS